MFTGDLTHTTANPVERHWRMSGFMTRKGPEGETVRCAGGHDASLDNGAFRNSSKRIPLTTGVHFAARLVSDPPHRSAMSNSPGSPPATAKATRLSVFSRTARCSIFIRSGIGDARGAQAVDI